MEMSEAYHVRDERLSLDDEDRKKLLYLPTYTAAEPLFETT
jgi:hypothetical protein